MPDFIDSIAWFTRENFAAHKALDPHGLQPTFDDWLRDAERGVKQLKLRGIVPERVVIDPNDFAAWCKSQSMKVDGRARGAFASVVRHKRSQN